MKKIFFFALALISLSSCNDKEAEQTIGRGDWTTINISQDVLFVDKDGTPLFDTNNPNSPFDEQYFSLIATDKNWDPLYSDKGNMMADIENNIEVRIYEDKKFILNFQLGNFQGEKGNEASYYLFRYNKNEYDKIIVYGNIIHGELHLDKIVYNSVLYKSTPIEEVLKITKSK
ncbi:membrane lipoprotein lipid attachment site-containing protein [Myroides indicus]|uniref:Type IV secretion system putative lipoprotein virB7 n=1 Tax=Myroides indicus TaxID=1323422 RepID=A0A4R7EXC6_9FLAO|nr:membrane lipoprotein lipid attachment site-containing protein [Myroides indicus]TDS58152.1 hypothetical protein C8P70_11364 [Myroides indicus]